MVKSWNQPTLWYLPVDQSCHFIGGWCHKLHLIFSQLEPLLQIVYQLKFLFHLNSIHDMQCNCVGYIVIVGWCEMNCKKQVLVLVLSRLVCRMFISRYFCLNQYHQLFPSIPSQNGVSLVYLSFVTFIFSCCGLMDNHILACPRST